MSEAPNQDAIRAAIHHRKIAEEKAAAAAASGSAAPEVVQATAEIAARAKQIELQQSELANLQREEQEVKEKLAKVRAERERLLAGQ
ncbi:hypothetical protein SAICODRAFT_31643 [Saitoella complicata NRRL Y-17804]|uniref:uncharacterized protein n=1 Tax=Saitoella complicata (strain BCRC 22490 / CBS 7301 / JCM 7358 / NBRC 10748 / NRRL Y-17804) TaxID=698492 RepID=UPI000867F617|nr:uncharacterized protein SAICODRAFT_31643 [Saitoella complicata NRRL Y-17804]ODQ50881.1 hypothetical protein SAICODRAFT_31643 [Saitoella complicata NRRL Y-17804]